MRILPAIVGFLAVIPSASSCLWDRDTLAEEASGRLEVVETVVGQFERKPRRFYEMRATRLLAEIEKPGASAELYDDLAVALDQVGRSSDAIAWMEKKRAVVERIRDSSARREQEYRLLANLGTFYAHRWARSTDDPRPKADLEKAIELIRQAIALNPHAHFGREKYQLQALEWYLAGEQPLEIKPPQTASEARSANVRLTFVHRDEVQARPDEALRGLCGIIQLGNAWENLDLTRTLLRACSVAEHGSLAQLAAWRAGELEKAGRTSAHGHLRQLARPENADLAEIAQLELDLRAEPHDTESLQTFYREARAVADENNSARLAFLEARFAAGAHPDTHPDFWRDAPVVKPLPLLPGAGFGRLLSMLRRFDPVTLLCALAACGVLLAYGWIVRSRRERRARLASLRYPVSAG